MGFEAPPHRGMPEPASLTAMAAAYADDVRGLVRAGVIGAHRPYVLGGNSFGAMVAHELARVLFDDCPPADVILVDPILVPYPPAPPPEPPAKMRAIPRVVRAARRRLRGRAPSPAPMPCSLEQVQRMSRRLREMHEPKVYPGSIVLITSEARRRLLDDELVQMRGFVLGDIVSHPLPGLHSTILADERAEQIAAIAGKVVKNCRR
jgi:thioesterase domain-containing protein